MPNFPIIDAHLHVWDQSRLHYSGFEANPLFNHPYLVEDYRAACGGVEVEAMVFIECYADFSQDGGQYFEEIAFVEDEARRDPRIRRIVPMAPLERGTAVRPMLEAMARHPLVGGIRRIIEFDDDPRALALSDDFIDGVNLLADFGWHFEINVNHEQMDIVREFVPRVQGVRLILDHCGKPGIKEGAFEQFRADAAALSRFPNVWVKLSDLPVEADLDGWTDADLRPFIEATLDSFGVSRTIFAADYPICLQASSIDRWVGVLDHAFADLGLSAAETRAIYHDNANQFYQLGL